jgi:hypothetical protein
MADRYWVGGAGSWNSTTKWSGTSGGLSGASVPTSADNAIFDANSGSAHFTVTVTTGATCANLTIAPEPVTGATIFSVAGSFTIAGTLSTNSTLGNRRIQIISSGYGLMRDVSISSVGTLSDVDFRDIRVIGAAGTISGTRIGNLGGCQNISFSTPKTVYWVTAAGGSWSGNNWASQSGGAASTDNFPLPQDTAIIENTGLNSATSISLDVALPNIGTLNMSTRTNSVTLSGTTSYSVYGDFRLGSGVTRSYSGILTFRGRNTQYISSAGKTLQAVTLENLSGTVELDNALNLTSTLTVTSGTFDTKGYSLTATSLQSTNSNIRTINLNNSTVSLSDTSPLNFATSINLNFNAGTSTIVFTNSAASVSGGGVTFYNVSFNSTTSGISSISGANTFNNFEVTSTTSGGLRQFSIFANQVISDLKLSNNTSAANRMFFYSSTLGTSVKLTVNNMSVSTNCDFRDIELAGNMANTLLTLAGDCGGNTNISFPSPKTVYWSFTGAANWSAIGWSAQSNGATSIDNFPLPQDTIIFDNGTGSGTTVTINAPWNIGTINASNRTNSMTLAIFNISPSIYGNWISGSGLATTRTTGVLIFSKRGTQTITCNGSSIVYPININSVSGTVQLNDALLLNTTTGVITLTSGTFDASSYNVNCAAFNTSGSSNRTLKMGSGTWSIGYTVSVWNIAQTTNFNFYPGTAEIIFTDQSTSSRTFVGGSLSYNKVTIGGATGTSTFNITGTNTFKELASTKTVAHTIAFGSNTQLFDKWSVTGTVGNLVTLTGTSTNHRLRGGPTSGINYLTMNAVGFFAAESTGEFYAGPNSTGTAGLPVVRTAPPTPRTLYWVGGTGNWSDTAKWSTSSGGSGGSAIPTSLDDVVFNSASNATSYTATINTSAKCNTLTITGPASGTLTLAGSSNIACNGNITFPTTGLSVTHTGYILLGGSSGSKTFNAGGLSLSSLIHVVSTNAEWSLGSNLTTSALLLSSGTINISSYNLTVNSSIAASGFEKRSINLGSGTTTVTNNFELGNSETSAANLTVTAGTSQITLSGQNSLFYGNGKTFYNLSFTNTNLGTSEIYGSNTFNNLSFPSMTQFYTKNVNIYSNQIINGTLSTVAGATASGRVFLKSSSSVFQRTLTCNSVSLNDTDFNGIAIAGTAAPASGVRLSDCKNNTNIQFPTPKTVYWNGTTGSSWGSNSWSNTEGGAVQSQYFPLAQDTVVITNTAPSSGGSIAVDSTYNIGTIDMSTRTNAITISISSSLDVFGNWINGSGTSISSTGSLSLTFKGRNSQTITSSGKTFTTTLIINSIGGSVTLNDSFTTSNASAGISLIAGTFNANGYNVTISNSDFNGTGTQERTLNIGSGTWTIGGSSVAWTTFVSTNLTIQGTGTIKFTSGSAKSFTGNNNIVVPTASYSGITIDQAGGGALTINGWNTLKNITNSYSSTNATDINFGTTVQKLDKFEAVGTLNKRLNLLGAALTNPCFLVITGTNKPDVDYLGLAGVILYPYNSTWYVGTNTTNTGSLGATFQAKPAVVPSNANFLFMF